MASHEDQRRLVEVQHAQAKKERDDAVREAAIAEHQRDEANLKAILADETLAAHDRRSKEVAELLSENRKRLRLARDTYHQASWTLRRAEQLLVDAEEVSAAERRVRFCEENKRRARFNFCEAKKEAQDLDEQSKHLANKRSGLQEKLRLAEETAVEEARIAIACKAVAVDKAAREQAAAAAVAALPLPVEEGVADSSLPTVPFPLPFKSSDAIEATLALPSNREALVSLLVYKLRRYRSRKSSIAREFCNVVLDDDYVRRAQWHRIGK